MTNGNVVYVATYLTEMMLREKCPKCGAPKKISETR